MANLTNISTIKLKIEGRLTLTSGSGFGIAGPLIRGDLAVSAFSWPSIEALYRTLASELGAMVPKIPDNGSPEQWMRSFLILCLSVLNANKVPAGSASEIRVSAASLQADGHHMRVLVRGWNLAAFKTTLQWLVDTCNHDRETADWVTLRQQLAEHALQGVNALRFISAACRRGFEVRPLQMQIWAFGTGTRQRWLDSSFTDKTSRLGTILAKNKMATASLLRSLGFPAPVHFQVDSRDRAIAAAAALGYPVVVKPADRDQGIGVAADLKDPAAVLTAYDAASRESVNILVEKHFEGDDYRITVVEGEVVKIVHRRPGGVDSDGQHTIAQLVERANEDPVLQRRSRDRGAPILQLDDQALDLLREQGLRPDSVAPAGQFVRLRRKANISAGGVGALVPPGSIHPDNARLAVDAAAALRLDIAGIDLLIQDISRSWLEIGSLICEVNAQPQIGSSTSPEVYDEILIKLVGYDPQVPSLLVLAPPEVTDVELIARMKEAVMMPGTGFSSSDSIYLAGRPIAKPPGGGFHAARALLANRSVQKAIMRMSVTDLLSHGLPCQRLAGTILWDEPSDALDSDVETPARRIQCISMMKPHVQRWIRIGSGKPGPWAGPAARESIRPESSDKGFFRECAGSADI